MSISPTFLRPAFCAFTKKLESQIVSREKLLKTRLHKAAALKMLMRLTPRPGVNFTKIIRAAFEPIFSFKEMQNGKQRKASKNTFVQIFHFAKKYNHKL